MTPNIPRSQSKGRLYLLSKDPDDQAGARLPLLHRTRTATTSRRSSTASRSPARWPRPARSSDWIEREIAPGPDITSDDELSTYGRAVHHTVYHPSGTCRMGAADDDLAVVDPDLRVRGIEGLSIADGSIFPSMPTVNPVVGTFMIGEKAADLVRER